MTLLIRAARVITIAAACNVWCAALYSIAFAQNSPQNVPGKNSSPTLVQQMVGTWQVRQRMWPGFGEPAIDMPPAVAHRRLIAGAFLEEVMEAVKKSGKESFVRTAYFDYNAVNRQYEYFSLDTRAPQMMNERSDKTDEQSKPGKDGIKLSGGNFIAPKWGDATSVAFTYRLTVGEIEHDSQTVRLYLTPQAGKDPKEFLAFEYVYTRKR